MFILIVPTFYIAIIGFLIGIIGALLLDSEKTTHGKSTRLFTILIMYSWIPFSLNFIVYVMLNH